jgi:hypothetical protein
MEFTGQWPRSVPAAGYASLASAWRVCPHIHVVCMVLVPCEYIHIGCIHGMCAILWGFRCVMSIVYEMSACLRICLGCVIVCRIYSMVHEKCMVHRKFARTVYVGCLVHAKRTC